MNIYKILLFITGFSLLLGQNSIAQNDTLNKFTPKGKKTGYWKVLLNNNVDPVDSLKDACFFGIELWDNGESVFTHYKKKGPNSKMKYDGVMPEKGNPKLIDGTFKWFNSKGFLETEETYKDGKPVYIKSYHVSKNKTDSTNELFEDLDFTILYNNIPGTYYYKEHDFSTNTYKEYWFRKGRRGWRIYKIKK